MISGAEAGRIGRALESVVDWTSEIIVVLNENVTDATEQIALKYGAKVFREPWKGHVAQKNSSAGKAREKWILGLDADEVVSPELREEIRRIFLDQARHESLDAFSFPRLTMFCGRWIRHGDWYPDRGTRLWRRGRAVWGGVDPHDKLVVDGKVGRLRSRLLHYNASSIDDQIVKISSYSNDFLRDALRQQRRASWVDLGIRPWWRFVRSYFLRLGFLDGWQGYYIARMTAFYTATRYVKVRAADEATNPAAEPPP
jgi:glycosyltransferase involved in cell wall biosynthesis